METRLRRSRLSNPLLSMLALGFVLLATAFSHAQIVPERAMEADRAVTRLQQAVEAGALDGDYPRLSDPAVAYLFTLAFDAEMLTGNAPTVDDLPILISLQDQAKRLARSYVAAGTQEEGAEGTSLDLAARNFLEFLPEIAVAYDFAMISGARISRITSGLASQIAAMGDEAPQIESSLMSVARDQAGVLELMIGCSSDANINRDWRRERLVLLNKTVHDYAALLPQEIAQSIADKALAAAIAESDVVVATEMKQFALSILR